MRQTASLLISLLALLPQPAMAQVIPYEFDFDGVESAHVETADSRPLDATSNRPTEAGDDRSVDEADDSVAETGDDRSVDEGDDSVADAGSDRFVEVGHRPELRAQAYGPFRVMDDVHAAMVGVTDERTPVAFVAMLRDHPDIAILEMIDCPGTEDDLANLRLGRMIRAKGIITHVPANGWVASGAVELFLAGVRRSADVSARFAVHSWEDDSGRGPNDYSPNDQKNRAYIDYYRIMGMSEDEAKAFYAMTNSAPFARPRYMTAREMMPWARYDDPVAVAVAARPGALARTEVGSAQARADF